MLDQFKVAVVTGAGQGLGAVLAQHLAARGLAVGVIGRNEAALHEVAGTIARGAAVRADITDPLAVGAAIEQIESALGPIDILINNAGAYIRKPFLQTTADEFDEVVRVNLFGAFHCTRAVLEGMLVRHLGAIVNISASGGRRGSAQHAAFNAAKFGLMGLTESLFHEVKAQGVHVSAVVIDGPLDVEKVRRGMPGIDARACIDPNEVAWAVEYLISQDSRAWTHELWLQPSGSG